MKRSRVPLVAAERPVVVTGGAGFIGSNVVHRLASAGQTVIVVDSLARPGVERNLEWLTSVHPDRVRVEVLDVREAHPLRKVIRHAGHVFHFAAQVAVTTSLVDPVDDFEVNARGTINVLEAIRTASAPISLLFTSTNKVYGDLADVAVAERDDRYEPRAGAVREHGIPESRPLSLHSPYGCSKGAADQYVLDYARCFGIPAIVFRMSCVYGPRQFGTEDQGWVAHFLIRAMSDEPIVVYGNGKQVRDVLFVDDLVDAMLLATATIEANAGNAYNIGGGPANAVSLREIFERIEALLGRAPRIERGGWRTGDQRYYVSDTRRFSLATGWSPRVTPAEGLERLWAWLREQRRADAATPRVAVRATVPMPAVREAPA